MSAKGVFIGTSGWTHDDWAGVFYPKEVRGADRLTYYATRFDKVEVNATSPGTGASDAVDLFYMPVLMVRRWTRSRRPPMSLFEILIISHPATYSPKASLLLIQRQVASSTMGG